MKSFVIAVLSGFVLLIAATDSRAQTCGPGCSRSLSCPESNLNSGAADQGHAISILTAEVLLPWKKEDY